MLLVLGLFSIISWSILFYRTWTFRRAACQSRSFRDVFRHSSKFAEVQAVCQSLSASPFVGLFQAGYAELSTQLRQTLSAEEAGNSPSDARRPTLKSLSAVDRALTRAFRLGARCCVPAVYFYNYLTTRVETFASEMDDLSMEFLNIAERNAPGPGTIHSVSAARAMDPHAELAVGCLIATCAKFR